MNGEYGDGSPDAPRLTTWPTRRREASPHADSDKQSERDDNTYGGLLREQLGRYLQRLTLPEQ